MKIEWSEASTKGAVGATSGIGFANIQNTGGVANFGAGSSILFCVKYL